jgi:putative ABC transport system permease protein
MHDLRRSIRALRAAPVVSAMAIVSFTVGIGANSAVFSIVNAVLLKPLPYPDPDRLVLLGYTFSGASVPLVSETKLNVWKDQASAWQDIAALRAQRVAVTEGDQVEQVRALQTNTDFFALFGARAALGRVFTAAEDRPGGDRVVLLSDGFWQRRFSSDPHIVGRPLRVDGSIATIVGVLDGTVDTAIFNVAPDVWIPLQLDPNSTDHPPSLIAAARLRPDTTIALAQAQARLAGNEFHRRFPQASGPDDTFTVAPFQEALVQNMRPSLLVLVGAVAFVLLISCANVANLMLIRGSVRQQEIAIRTALGATRWQIVRQLVTESLMLAFIGGSLGLAFGEAGVRILLALNPAELPRVGPDAAGITVDWRVASFTFAISAITGLVCGLWPARRLSTGDQLLHVAGRGRSGATARDRRVRGLLVVSQMALALVLLVGATLLIRTFLALNQVDRGYDADRVLTLRVALAEPRFTKTSAVEQLVRTTVERVTALPGVVGAAATRTLPLESDWRTSVRIVGRPFNETSPAIVSYRIISPEYFNILSVPIVQGRALMDRDGPGAPPVAVINQAMARRYWPDGDALNNRLIAFPGRVPDDEPAREIVGIVSNVRDGMPLEQDERPTMYVPLAQLLDRESEAQAPGGLAWIIRTRSEPAAVARSIEREIARAGADTPVADVRSLDQLAARAIAPTAFSMSVLSVFGACALLLAATGMYGVIAYAVQQRTYEIAVRLAIGARWHQIRNMVLLDGLKLAACGVALGIPAATALTGTLSAFLFGVVPHDLLTFMMAPLLLSVVAFAAVWVPATRASRIDPAKILRGCSDLRI